MNSQRIALGLMAASGLAGLGYQIVWTQQCALWLGHEAAALLAVVTAFFGGMATGAAILGRRIERSQRPERWYAACEAVIAAWGACLVVLMAPASAALLKLTGPEPMPAWQWLVAFTGSFVLLLPATAAMGATLPAMERVSARLRPDGVRIGGLYAANTFGAVLGVLASAFWLVPQYGMTRTALVCVTLNVLCALAALTLRVGKAPPMSESARTDSRCLLALMAATGLLGIGYEVLVVRVLSQVAENTVYTYAMLLAVYLVGTTIGAALYQAYGAAPHASRSPRTRGLLRGLAVACLLGLGGMWFAPEFKGAALRLLGTGMSSALLAEAVIAVAAFAPAAVMMGALFSHLGDQVREQGVGFSRALAFNTFGASIAPLLFGTACVPTLGLKQSLLLVVAGYLALSMWRTWHSAVGWGGAAALVILALWAPPLAFVDVPEGGHVVSYREGVTAAVSIVEDLDGVARLRIDNRQQEGSTATRFADARQAVLPLMLHAQPRHALFLGLGTGVTARSATDDPLLQVDAVELLPEVIEASGEFALRVFGSREHPRLRLIAADARRFVRASAQRYDVIISDNFHPARSGSGALYTVEHFRAVRDRLAPGGLFCQWLPLHQLDLDTLRSIVRAFSAAYPQAYAILATNSLQTPVLGLVAREDGMTFDARDVRERLRTTALPKAPLGLDDEFAVFGAFIAGPRALARWSGDAAMNTDDHPVVAHSAPRIVYAPDSPPAERLLALLHEVCVTPADVVLAPESGFSARLAAYWSARDGFLSAGRGVRPDADPRRMLAQVREPLLAALRRSPDFRPAYDPLLHMAGALADTDPLSARSLLSELARLQPARPEALQALHSLAATR